ncbi:MAG TPA: hypothetical protein ENJ91_06100 [Rhodobacteraceae bacterium]|nr:hypothetical protein [Paracoccaceae bacterium]
MSRMLLTMFVIMLSALPLSARPVKYLLETEKSSVGFIYNFNGNPTKGIMPVAAADLLVDLDRLGNTRIRVTLNARKAKAGFIFATDAMRSEKVLYTRRFPHIVFVSQQVRPHGKGARIKGLVTVRGVTRPMILDAGFFRQKGTVAGDRSHLSILLTGSIMRSEFGAVGYPDLVGDRIDLRILARIKMAN